MLDRIVVALFALLFSSLVPVAKADPTGHEQVGHAKIGLGYQTPDGRASRGAALLPSFPSTTTSTTTVSPNTGSNGTPGPDPAGDTTIGTLERWPAGVKYDSPYFPYFGWKSLDPGNVAYYRDAFTALTYVAQASHDGETWDVTATVSPAPGGVWSGSQSEYFQWPTLTYYAQLNGVNQCFNSPGWSAPVCGTTAVYITAYIASQCEPYGGWTFNVSNDGAQVGSRQLTMIPRVPDNDGDVVSYNQGAYPVDLTTDQPSTNWYDDRCYAVDNNNNTILYKDANGNTRFNCSTFTPPSGYTLKHFSIARLGCYLTSGAMMLHYFGDIVDPPGLNTFLNSLGIRGYVNGDVQPTGVAQHSGGAMTYLGRFDGTYDDTLKGDICQYGPQIMAVKNNGHFVMVVGRTNDDSDWQIRDPNGGGNVNLTSKYSGYNGFRLFKGQDSVYNDPIDMVVLKLFSPAELLVTAPDGRRTGLNPITGAAYKEIPFSSYGTDALDDNVTGEADPDPQKIMEIHGAAAGTYTLQVTGTGSGTYTLQVERFDATNSFQAENHVANIPITPGEVQYYQLNYDPTSSAPLELKRVTDTTPPVTVAHATPPANAYGWNNTDVTVSFSSTDSEPGGTGVKEIHVTLSGARSGSTVTPGGSASVTVSAEGTTVVSYYAIDNAGNVEQPKTLTLKVDKTPPVISGMPAPGCTLWPPNHKLVSVATVSAADSLSGVATFILIGTSSEPDDADGPDVVVTGSGATQEIELRAERLGTGNGRTYTITGTATDFAGNVTTANATCTVPHDQGQ